MSHVIIDRRKNSKGKSVSNRQKFIRRAKEQVKEAVKEHVRRGNIADVASSDGKRVNIPVRDLNQPTFRHGEGGRKDMVHPGNKEFITGDRINRPPQGGGQGDGEKEASDQIGGEDSFEFHLTREEFLDIFFEGLELPDMVKRQIKTVDHWENRRAGFSTDGTPSRLNLLRTMTLAKGRRVGITGSKKKKLRVLIQELKLLEEQMISFGCVINPDLDEPVSLPFKIDEFDIATAVARRNKLRADIAEMRKRVKKVPFIDDIDLRYNRWERTAIPATQAVMYCIMDVSGSMGEWEKEMSKSFFMLMYLFLFKQYKRVNIVYIRHHSIAKVVDEDEFFHSRESGGTVVSSGLEKMYNHIKDFYPLDQWNIYGCQCSDGDNFPYDREATRDWMKKLLNIVQYYAYVEIDRNGGKDSDLWAMYNDMTATYPHFNMNVVSDASEIYPVFRKLFEKRAPTTGAPT